MARVASLFPNTVPNILKQLDFYGLLAEFSRKQKDFCLRRTRFFFELCAPLGIGGGRLNSLKCDRWR